MSDTQSFAMVLGKRNLFCIMIAAIIERNGQRDTFLIVVKQGRGVHASAENQYTILHLFVFLLAKVLIFWTKEQKKQKNISSDVLMSK